MSARAVSRAAAVMLLGGAAGLLDMARAAEDIRDIRGPKTLAQTGLLAASIVLALLVVLACYIVWRWRRRGLPKPLTAHAMALEQLAATRPLMNTITAREFCVAAADILRHYVEQRFAVVATHMTTEEFLRHVLSTPDTALAAQRELLADFLTRCDIVKFSGTAISMQDLESLYQSAYKFILEAGAAATSVRHA